MKLSATSRSVSPSGGYFRMWVDGVQQTNYSMKTLISTTTGDVYHSHAYQAYANDISTYDRWIWCDNLMITNERPPGWPT